MRIVVALLAVAAASVAAQTYDQSYTELGGGAWSIVNFAPVGQTFTPTLDRIEFIDVKVGHKLPTLPEFPDSRGATLVARLRATANPSSPVVATSLPVLLPNAYGRYDPDVFVRFRFANPVTLTPGVERAFEVMLIEGDPDTQFFLLLGHGPGGYGGGTAYTSATPLDFDFWFREGVGPLPPELSPRCSDGQADQCNIASPTHGFGPIKNMRQGQTFTPTLSKLQYIQVRIGQGIPTTPGQPDPAFATFQARVLDGVRLDSPVIGVSRPVTLPGGFGRPAGDTVTFTFPIPVPLTPDRTHAFEIVFVDGDEGSEFFGLGGSAGYVRGNVMGESSSADFWFREGIDLPNDEVPVPALGRSGLVLLACALAVVAAMFHFRHLLRSAK